MEGQNTKKQVPPNTQTTPKSVQAKTPPQADSKATDPKQTPPVSTKTSVVHGKRRIPKLVVVFLPLILIVIAIAFVLLRKQNMAEPVIENPYTTHTFDDFPDFTGIPITDNTISFLKVDNKFCLLYKGIVYFPQDTGSLTPRTKKEDSEIQGFPWKGLLETQDDEIYSFASSPSNKSFVFITRGAAKDGDEYRMYRFINNSISELKVFKPSDGTVYVPKIFKFSPGGNFLNLSMFTCADCLSERPDTLLYYIPTGDTRNIGQVSEFNWTDDDNVYQYKLHKEGVDPKTVPLQTNEFFAKSVDLLNP